MVMMMVELWVQLNTFVECKLHVLVGGSNVSMRGVEKQELKRKGAILVDLFFMNNEIMIYVYD
jgi:hypothetical protein